LAGGFFFVAVRKNGILPELATRMARHHGWHCFLALNCEAFGRSLEWLTEGAGTSRRNCGW